MEQHQKIIKPHQFVNIIKETEDMDSSFKNASLQADSTSSGNSPVNVNIVVNDPECAAYISSVGIFVLYYCNHCGMAADSLQCLTKHLVQSGTHSTRDPTVNIKQHIDSITVLANERLLFPNKRDGSNDNETADQSNSSNTICTQNDGVTHNHKENRIDINESEVASIKDEQGESDNEEMDVDCNTLTDTCDNHILHILETNIKEEIKPNNETTSITESDVTIIQRSMFVEDYLNFVDENVDMALAKRKFQDSKIEISKENSTMDDIVSIDIRDKVNCASSIMPKSNQNDSVLSCKHCPLLIFSSEVELDLHQQCHSNELPGFSFKCYLCNQHAVETKEWHQMRQHLHKVHEVNLKCRCSECKEKFESVEALREHKIKVHRMYCKFKDEGCKYCTNSKFDLQLHHSCHQTASDFHCCECNYKNKKLKQNTWPFIREHIAKKHVHLLDQKNQCPSCLSTFLDSESFQSHSIICKKLDSVKHKCMFCAKANYVMLPNLRQHVQRHCNTFNVVVNTKFEKALDMKQKDVSMYNIYCILAAKGKTESAQKLEKKSGTESMSMKSEKCIVEPEIVMKFPSDIRDKDSISYKSEVQENKSRNENKGGSDDNIEGIDIELLQSDVSAGQSNNEITSSESSATDIYSIQFSNKEADATNALNKPNIKLSFQEKYNVSIDDDGTFKCNMCYKKLKCQRNFLRHMAKSHPQGHDRTQCRVCGKTFRTRNQCKNHYHYQHAGKKRKCKKYDPSKKSNRLLYCDSCTYTTPHPTRLRNHIMSTHQGVMPYKCDKCTYSTNEHSDLRRHKNKHLGIKKYECEHCDYRAAQRWLLANHCLKQHNIELPPHRPNVDLLGSAGSLRRQQNRVTTTITSAEDENRVENFEFSVNTMGELPIVEENTLIEYLEVPQPTRQIILQPDTQLVTEVIFLPDGDIM